MGCAFGSPQEQAPAADAAEATPIWKTITIEGELLSTESHVAQCYAGKHLHATAIELDTTYPTIPKWEIPCEPVQERTSDWLLHCRKYVDIPWPGFPYWDDLTIHIDKHTLAGYFYWWNDGLHYFHCIHTFEIQVVEVEDNGA